MAVGGGDTMPSSMGKGEEEHMGVGMSPNSNPQPNNFAALGKNAFWPESVLLCVVRDCLEEGVKDEPQASSSNSPCSLFLRYAFAKCRREFPCRRKDPCGMSMEGTCPPLLSLSLRAFSSALVASAESLMR